MKYTCQQFVYLRKEPRVIEITLANKTFVTNRVGALNTGDQREIVEVVSDNSGKSWGRVTNADPNGKAIWVCISTTNIVFMKPTTNDTQPPVVVSGSLEERVARLEAEVFGGSARKMSQ